jgi:hypothetical protein
VEIEPRIGPAQYHHKEIFVTHDEAIGPERRIEIIFICFNPALEMVSGEKIHGTSNFLGVLE